VGQELDSLLPKVKRGEEDTYIPSGRGGEPKKGLLAWEKGEEKETVLRGDEKNAVTFSKGAKTQTQMPLLGTLMSLRVQEKIESKTYCLGGWGNEILWYGGTSRGKIQKRIHARR